MSKTICSNSKPTAIVYCVEQSRVQYYIIVFTELVFIYFLTTERVFFIFKVNGSFIRNYVCKILIIKKLSTEKNRIMRRTHF